MNIARIASLAAFAAFAAGAIAAPAVGARAMRQAELAPADGEVIVRFKTGAGITRLHALAAHADNNTVDQTLARRAATLGGRVGRALHAGHAVGEHTQVMRTSGMSAAALAALLKADPDVEYAVPNGRQRILTAPNDPLYPAVATGVRPNGPDSGQWYLRAPAGAVVSSIDIESAWARTIGSPSVVVAVLDTGVRKDHPDLAGRLVGGYDFVSDSLVANDGDGRDADASDPGDWVTTADTKTTKFSGCTAGNSSWHGTSTASLVGAGANDGVGMAGTAPGVRVLPVRVLGKCFGTDADIQAGMRWAAGISVSGVPDNPNPAKVLNMSLGSSGACSAAYQSAVDDVLAKGAVIVASAGNSAGEPVGTPANCKGVIAVLALRHVGTKVGFSDMGPEIAIAAPGGNCVNTAAGSPCLYPILAADNTGTQGPVSSAWTNSFNPSLGTSFSAPLVAATVGLMFSQQAVLTPAQVLAALKSTATAFPTTGGDNGDGSTVAQCHAPSTGVEQLQCYCTTSFCGAGMLNAGAAVAAVSGPLARIGITTASPAAGSAVTLSAESSSPGGGVAIVSYLWTLVDGGGIATAFSSATNASTATLTPTAQGNFVVNLRVTDSQGRSNETSQTVTVAAAPVVAAAPSGGGGGAASVTWVLLLLAGAVALWRAPPGGRPKAPSRKA